jgi:hypothetical protein
MIKIFKYMLILMLITVGVILPNHHLEVITDGEAYLASVVFVCSATIIYFNGK